MISLSTSFFVTPSADVPALVGDAGDLEDENIATERAEAPKRRVRALCSQSGSAEQLWTHLHNQRESGGGVADE